MKNKILLKLIISMKNLVLFLLLLVIVPCNSQIKIDYFNNDSLDLKVDSLSTNHFKSIKFKTKNNKPISASDKDYLFLILISHFSSIDIEFNCSYGLLPVFVKPYEINRMENWYLSNQNKISWDNVNKFYLLWAQRLKIKSNDFDEFLSKSDSIENELNKFRIN